MPLSKYDFVAQCDTRISRVSVTTYKFPLYGCGGGWGQKAKTKGKPPWHQLTQASNLTGSTDLGTTKTQRPVLGSSGREEKVPLGQSKGAMARPGRSASSLSSCGPTTAVTAAASTRREDRISLCTCRGRTGAEDFVRRKRSYPGGQEWGADMCHLTAGTCSQNRVLRRFHHPVNIPEAPAHPGGPARAHPGGAAYLLLPGHQPAPHSGEFHGSKH